MRGIPLGGAGGGRLFLLYLTSALQASAEPALRFQMGAVLSKAGVRLADIDVGVVGAEEGRSARLARLLMRMQLADRHARLAAFQAEYGHAVSVRPFTKDALLSAFTLYARQYPAVLSYHEDLKFPSPWLPTSMHPRGLHNFGVLCLKIRRCMDLYGEATHSTGISYSQGVAMTRLRNAARAGKLPETMAAALRWARFAVNPTRISKRHTTASKEATWRKKAKRIIAAGKAQGHFRFSSSSDKVWCSTQRRRFRAGTMPAWQELRLRHAGFPFESGRGCPFGPDWFRERLVKLKNDVERNGGKVPRWDTPSGKFLFYMRTLKKQGKLCRERRVALEAIGSFVLKWRRVHYPGWYDEVLFRRQLAKLKKYIERNGGKLPHWKTPSGLFVRRMRSLKTEGKLGRDRRVALDAIGSFVLKRGRQERRRKS